MNARPPRTILTVKEAADYLKVHPSTMYRLLNQRRVPAFKVGSDWRLILKELDRWRLAQPTAHKRGVD